jgi:hypothetical protein
LSVDPSKLTAEEVEDLARLQHFAAIGYVAGNWGYFEAVVDTWSLSIAGIKPQPGVCFTSQIAGAARKLDAFIALLGLVRPEHGRGKDIDAFCKDAMGLAEQRNRIVHDHWDTSDILSPKRLEATARRKLKLEKINVPTSDILDLAIKISDLTHRFESLAS